MTGILVRATIIVSGYQLSISTKTASHHVQHLGDNQTDAHGGHNGGRTQQLQLEEKTFGTVRKQFRACTNHIQSVKSPVISSHGTTEQGSLVLTTNFSQFENDAVFAFTMNV